MMMMIMGLSSLLSVTRAGGGGGTFGITRGNDFLTLFSKARISIPIQMSFISNLPPKTEVNKPKKTSEPLVRLKGVEANINCWLKL